MSDFEGKIVDALSSDNFFENSRQLLIQAKEDGISKFQVGEVLDGLLVRFDEDENFTDRVLEINDIVHGFCQPKYKVWS